MAFKKVLTKIIIPYTLYMAKMVKTLVKTGCETY
jgi:hypothetical protein